MNAEYIGENVIASDGLAQEAGCVLMPPPSPPVTGLPLPPPVDELLEHAAIMEPTPTTASATPNPSAFAIEMRFMKAHG
jgi:hypothetical protein